MVLNLLGADSTHLAKFWVLSLAFQVFHFFCLLVALHLPKIGTHSVPESFKIALLLYLLFLWLHIDECLMFCHPLLVSPLFSLPKEHQRQRRRRGRWWAPGESRLHPAVPAGLGQGADPVPHHLHRGNWPGHHHAGAWLAGGCHWPGPGLPEGGRPQNSRVGGQDCPGGPGAGLHHAEGKPRFTCQC